MSAFKLALLAPRKGDTFRMKSRRSASTALNASPFLRHQAHLRNPEIWRRVGREAVVFFCIVAIGLIAIVLRP